MTVEELLSQLADIGRDPATGGYYRFAYTGADVELRNWFVRQAHDRGFRTETDRNGNLWATRGQGPYLATGSHLDSVPNGGPFDGPLGIASAFIAIDRFEGDRDLAVVAFAEEEGARFGVACLGSRLATGTIDPERARRLEDRNGVSLETAMADAGLDPGELGPDPDRLQKIESFVELHIEQGRGLVHLGAAVGVGEAIWPHGRWRIEFNGRADHAGTTRMEDRRDPMLPFAETVLGVTNRASKLKARATFGRVAVEPNGTNAIASKVTAWLDARAAIDDDLTALVDGVVGMEGVEVNNESLSPGVDFDPGLRDRVAQIVGSPPLVSTAAGHDAGVLATAGVPAAMLFVRNATGVSHSPFENATSEDCAAGVDALTRLLAAL